MGRGLFARTFAVVAALGLALGQVGSHPLPAAAASSTGTLFGLGMTVVLKIDPATGVATTFANLPAIPPTEMNPSFNGLASDPVGHRLFTVRSSISADFTTQFYNLVTIDTQTASTSVGPDMAQGAPDLVYDTSGGALYGVTNFCCPFQLVRIDPATGVQTHIADLPGVQESFMAIAPAKHVIYMASQSFVLGQFQPVLNMLTVDTTTGAIATSPPLTTGAFAFAYDTSTGTLLAKSFCCPANLLQIDPATGAEATVSTTDLGYGSGFAMDSASHSIYMTQDVSTGFSFYQLLQSVNDQTGVVSVSTTPLPSDGGFLTAMAFEGVAITPGGIRADVQSALASGAITNGGVATSLLSELNAASGARSRGQCSVAARVYSAFINELNAQSGKAVSASTASRLIGEAQSLIASCP